MDSTINLIPGMKADIGIKTDLAEGGRGMGAFAYLKPKVKHQGVEYDVINGWIVEDNKVGTIEANGTKPSVIYTHKKPEKNALYFFNHRGSMVCAVYVITVPIHDHSSIAGGGGPALATYFSDDESIE